MKPMNCQFKYVWNHETDISTLFSCELNPLFAKLDPETVDVDVHSPPLLSSLFSRNRAMLASNLRFSAPVGTALQIVAQE